MSSEKKKIIFNISNYEKTNKGKTSKKFALSKDNKNINKLFVDEDKNKKECSIDICFLIVKFH